MGVGVEGGEMFSSSESDAWAAGVVAVGTGAVCVTKCSGVEKGCFLGLRDRDFAGLERPEVIPLR
jgi:hypothetical protein